MLTTNTYLNFKNNCEAAFQFYKSVFGGEFIHVGRFGEMPEDENYKVPDSDKNKIMHISLPIGQSVLMGSDCGSAYEAGFIQGNNFSISINADSKDDADRYFAGLSNGGTPTMPMSQTFWGSYFGMLTDPFGVSWMISFDQQSTQ
jgi:PhnB protein